MANMELAEIWEQRIKEQDASGLNIAAWCREHTVSRHQYFYWRKKLGYHGPVKSGSSQNLPVKWVPLHNDSIKQTYWQSNTISVHVGLARIELANGFDPETFR